MNRCIVSLLTLLPLAGVAHGQLLDYTVTGVIDSASSGISPEIWDPVQVGDPFTLVYRVDSGTSTSFDDGLRAIYTEPVLEIEMNIGGILATLDSLSGSTVQISDDRTGPTSCTDDLEIQVLANSFDVDTLDLFLVATATLPTCPATSNSGTGYPATVDPSGFTTANSICLKTTEFGVFTGVINAITMRPSNDECADAIDLPGGFSDTPYDPRNATTDGADSGGFCDYGFAGDDQNYQDIWFRYTPVVTGCTYISTFGLAGYDTRLSVYDSTACPDDPANMIACVDEESFPINFPFEAGLDVSLVAGTTYLIRLGTFDAFTAVQPGVLRIAAGPVAEASNGGANPGAPGCELSLDLCNGDGGNQAGCTDCPCGNNASPGTIGGCLNSAGGSTRLFAEGDPSVSLPSGSTTDLRLRLSGGPPMATSVLLSGSAVAPQNMANPCFGASSGSQAADRDGLRCAVQSVLRHGNRSTDGSGNLTDSSGPSRVWGGEAQPVAGIAGQGGFVAGQSRFFQVTHRDDPLLVCMRGLNTSQAVQVTFTP